MYTSTWHLGHNASVAATVTAATTASGTASTDTVTTVRYHPPEPVPLVSIWMASLPSWKMKRESAVRHLLTPNGHPQFFMARRVRVPAESLRGNLDPGTRTPPAPTYSTCTTPGGHANRQCYTRVGMEQDQVSMRLELNGPSRGAASASSEVRVGVGICIAEV